MNQVFKNPAIAQAIIDETELTKSNLDPVMVAVCFSTALRIPSATIQDDPAAQA